jgi:transcriptional regulator with XRE-family HTH domain
MASMNEIDDGPKELYTFVGQRICEIRSGKRMTQASLAISVGLNRTSITNIEKGRQKILLHTLFEIASALKTEPKNLLPTPAEISDGNQNAIVPQTVGKRDRDVIADVIRKAPKGS